jgi:hypothetical protein
MTYPGYVVKRRILSTVLREARRICERFRALPLRRIPFSGFVA